MGKREVRVGVGKKLESKDKEGKRIYWGLLSMVVCLWAIKNCRQVGEVFFNVSNHKRENKAARGKRKWLIDERGKNQRYLGVPWWKGERKNRGGTGYGEPVLKPHNPRQSQYQRGESMAEVSILMMGRKISKGWDMTMRKEVGYLFIIPESYYIDGINKSSKSVKKCAVALKRAVENRKTRGSTKEKGGLTRPFC